MSSSSPKQAPGLPIQARTNSWMKNLAGLAVIIIVITIIINIFGGFKSSKHGGVDAYGWNLVETINCPMGKASWDKGQGWCKSKTLEPGTYRFILREVAWEAAFWDPAKQQVVGYRSVPPQGISLSEWQNDPTYVRTFLKDAPVGENRRFGSIVAKIDGQAFDPSSKGTFEIGRATTISIGPNIPYCDTAFVHNRGSIIVEIEKEM